MIQDVRLPDLYRGKVNLWIEDATARLYLKACWQDDPDILFLTTGGNENVKAVVNDAEERGYRTVFGLCDRDFYETNRPHWLDSAKGFRCFVIEVHELENYLLDEAALAGCSLNTGGRSAEEIVERLRNRAGELAWWMACRSVIADLGREFRAGFLEHPKCPEVTDLQSAEQCIVTQDWFQQLHSRTAKATAAGAIAKRLRKAYAFYRAHLGTDEWRSTFSGKELFRSIRGWVYTSPPGTASRSELDIDLAKAIASRQVETGSVPPEVVELRQAIRQKAGL
jgi:hypothetical protein